MMQFHATVKLQIAAFFPLSLLDSQASRFDFNATFSMHQRVCLLITPTNNHQKETMTFNNDIKSASHNACPGKSIREKEREGRSQRRTGKVGVKQEKIKICASCACAGISELYKCNWSPEQSQMCFAMKEKGWYH